MRGGEEGSLCEVSVDGRRVEHVLYLKYLQFVGDESGIDGVVESYVRRGWMKRSMKMSTYNLGILKK